MAEKNSDIAQKRVEALKVLLSGKKKYRNQTAIAKALTEQGIGTSQRDISKLKARGIIAEHKPEAPDEKKHYYYNENMALDSNWHRLYDDFVLFTKKKTVEVICDVRVACIRADRLYHRHLAEAIKREFNDVTISFAYPDTERIYIYYRGDKGKKFEKIMEQYAIWRRKKKKGEKYPLNFLGMIEKIEMQTKKDNEAK